MTPRRLYPSYFKLQVRWLLSLTRITYLSKLIGTHSFAAFLKFELSWVYISPVSSADHQCIYVDPAVVGNTDTTRSHSKSRLWYAGTGAYQPVW